MKRTFLPRKKEKKKLGQVGIFSALSVEFRAAACLIMTGGGAANFRDIILLNL